MSTAGTPMANANTENTLPKIKFIDKVGILINPPNWPKPKSTKAIKAIKPINIAITFNPTFNPSLAPAAIASTKLACVFSMDSFTSPCVSDFSVSGNMIFEITKAPGAAIKLAANKYAAGTPKDI